MHEPQDNPDHEATESQGRVGDTLAVLDRNEPAEREDRDEDIVVAVFGKLMDALKTIINDAVGEASKTEAIRLDRVKIEESTRRLEIEKISEHRVLREWTIRLLGGASLLGLVAYLIIALMLGTIADPIAALPTLATVISTLVLLGHTVRARRRSAKTDDNDGA